jgi:hypothetical protein
MTIPEETDITARRRWLAIGAATIPLLFSYISIAAAFTTDADGESLVGAGGAALGFGLVPFVFLLLAFVSVHKAASMAVLKAMGWFLLLAFPIGVLAPALGATAGYAAGATVALRPSIHSNKKVRWVAAGLTVVYVLFLLLFIPAAGIMAGAMTPLMAIGFADEYSIWMANRSGQRV